jgi:hypothetical protein
MSHVRCRTSISCISHVRHRTWHYVRCSTRCRMLHVLCSTCMTYNIVRDVRHRRWQESRCCAGCSVSLIIDRRGTRMAGLPGPAGSNDHNHHRADVTKTAQPAAVPAPSHDGGWNQQLRRRSGDSESEWLWGWQQDSDLHDAESESVSRF